MGPSAKCVSLRGRFQDIFLAKMLELVLISFHFSQLCVPARPPVPLLQRREVLRLQQEEELVHRRRRGVPAGGEKHGFRKKNPK